MKFKAYGLFLDFGGGGDDDWNLFYLSVFTIWLGGCCISEIYNVNLILCPAKMVIIFIGSRTSSTFAYWLGRKNLHLLHQNIPL